MGRPPAARRIRELLVPQHEQRLLDIHANQRARQEPGARLPRVVHRPDDGEQDHLVEHILRRHTQEQRRGDIQAGLPVLERMLRPAAQHQHAARPRRRDNHPDARPRAGRGPLHARILLLPAAEALRGRAARRPRVQHPERPCTFPARKLRRNGRLHRGRRRRGRPPAAPAARERRRGPGHQGGRAHAQGQDLPVGRLAHVPGARHRMAGVQGRPQPRDAGQGQGRLRRGDGPGPVFARAA